ncbi:MAG: helix-turn-helix transcriptional regulator [Chloroflexi bacterium]|nr:helix-turn-helix transcriptional regulator [Chloroflexota bacterium]
MSVDGNGDARVVGLVAYDPSRDLYLLIHSKASSQREKSRRGPRGELSPRELQVLHLVAVGNSNEELARKLGISLNTAKRHLQSIFVRLGAVSRSEAVARALREGWLRYA